MSLKSTGEGASQKSGKGIEVTNHIFLYFSCLLENPGVEKMVGVRGIKVYCELNGYGMCVLCPHWTLSFFPPNIL